MRVPPLVAGCGEKPPRSPSPAAERPDRREGQHGDEVWVAHALLVAVLSHRLIRSLCSLSRLPFLRQAEKSDNSFDVLLKGQKKTDRNPRNSCQKQIQTKSNESNKPKPNKIAIECEFKGKRKGSESFRAFRHVKFNRCDFCFGEANLFLEILNQFSTLD